MKVTSESLFHFTDSIENLENILKNKFYLTFCKEEFKLSTQLYSNYLPMISFCDIPLSLAKEQISNYGYYAIGMSKEWGISNRLNPVLYLESNSIIANDINNSRQELTKMNDIIVDVAKTSKFFPKGLIPITDNVTQIVDSYLNTLRFIKNYKGTLIRMEKTYHNYRFYDEREWRYIPEYRDKRVKPSIKYEEYQAYRGDSKEKPLIKTINIQFKAKDIRYLIVNSNSDIPRLIRAIKSSNNLVDNSDEADILATNITTIEQLNNDF